FPRSSEHGPIEAVSLALQQPGGPKFPRSSERGPIEAVSLALQQPGGPKFPRSSERGPIEARSARSDPPTPRLRNFRAHLSAAPLKLIPLESIGGNLDISALI